jgi:hypothetical protein
MVMTRQAKERDRLQSAIRGTIADTLDYPVASARVVISGSGLRENLCVTTGSEGRFMFNRVPPGIYTMEVNYSGFDKLVQRGIAVQDNAITGLNLKMNFQEDSRSLKLQSLNLNYLNDVKSEGIADEPSLLARQFGEVVAALRLDKALLNPPAVLVCGRRAGIEFGVYQNLRDEIMRGLLERRIVLFESRHIDIALCADLQVAGCLALPGNQSRLAIDGARYAEWQWEVLPQLAGQGMIHLSMDVKVNFGNRHQEDKRLLFLERPIGIRRNPWLKPSRILKKIIGGVQSWTC